MHPQEDSELSLGKGEASWRKRHLSRLIAEGSQVEGGTVG